MGQTLVIFAVCIGIFIFFSVLTFLCNGCKVRSRHNRPKPTRRGQQQQVYVITMQSSSPLHPNVPMTSSPPNANVSVPHVITPPPAYTTLDIEPLSSRHTYVDTVPPPSYDEAVGPTT